MPPETPVPAPATDGANGAWTRAFAALHAKDNADNARPARTGPPVGEELAPDPDLPVSHVVTYRTAGITRLAAGAGAPREIDGPLDPLAAPATGAGLPAEGALLSHEQAWRQRGVTLGRLLHSVALAPGEVTQIAMSTWDRSSAGGTSEDVAAEETAAQAAGRDRGIHEVTSVVAHQVGVGTSSTSALASQTDSGVTGVAGFLGVASSGSANSSVATAVAFATGARGLASDSTRSVREATQQQAANVRGQRSTTVQEVHESETEQFTTRVVANYNHMHALTLLYFEVLQVYELATRVTDAERLLFLPMAATRFDDPDQVTAFARPLADAARATGLDALAQRLERLDEDGPARTARRAALEGALDAARSAAAGVAEGTAPEIAAALDGAVAAALAQVELAEEAQAHELADLGAQLQDRQLAFDQAIWMRLEPDQVAAMLAGRWHEGAPLADTIDPAPVAVVGNLVGFRWAFPEGQEAAAAAFRARHVSGDEGGDESGDEDATDRDTVVLPTGGVFAEAVLGRANCGETLDLTRFWRWDDTTIPIQPTAIERLRQRRHARLAEARPAPLGAPAVAVQQLPEAPAGPAHELAGLIGTSLFRDAGGAAVIGEVLTAAQGTAAKGSAEAQQVAHDTISAYLDHVEQLLPTITKALSRAKAPSQGGQGAAPGAPDDRGGSGGGKALDPSTLGALQNALGEKGAGVDVEGLLGSAAELGLFL
ncbi:hypothetical protein [Pseudonocardia sp.]|uniref:hypothetical protein n=1 Tax=Pseudonocardia sp. TaxID=60912 RepID=UPI003D11F102